MRTWGLLGVVLLVSLAQAQVPKRLQIPGAIPLGGGPLERPLPLRRQQPIQAPPRLRRPVPNALPAPLPAIRPVVEEPEEREPQVSALNLNEEVARLHQLPSPSSTPRQQLYEEDEEDEPAPRPYIPAPVQFRPERPPIQPVRAAPPPVRQAQPVRAPPVRQQNRPAPRPQYDEEDAPRRDKKKPQVQILRKYREDNPDGSITWGFENDDGTFKEEVIGVDCITRGKYGYIDPDGNRREYTYETGLKCDEPEPELPEEPFIQPGKQFKRPPPQPIRLQ